MRSSPDKDEKAGWRRYDGSTTSINKIVKLNLDVSVELDFGIEWMSGCLLKMKTWEE